MGFDLKSLIGFGNANYTNKFTELPDIYPIGCTIEDFVRQDIKSTFEKILVDVLERTHGVPENKRHVLYDSFVQTEGSKGLISILVDAIVKRQDVFIVYKNDVVRIADRDEEKKIKADYEKQAKSKEGIFVSFRHFDKSKMLEIYSRLEYCVIGSLRKTLGISQAVQVKLSGLRSNIGANDAQLAIDQGKQIADALAKGKDILIDKEDQIENATPDLSATDKAMIFLDGKKAWILGFPISYINGEQTGGIGSTGEGDTKAIERGLKAYFSSIIQPVLKELMGLNVKFKSQDFRQLTSALEALKTFELSSGEILSEETMRDIASRLFDVDTLEEERRLKKEEKDRLKELEDAINSELENEMGLEDNQE